ncbi:MAG: repeat-containing protein, partial [Verrucomicrobiales bacterium]|nr:repeat-containing protein [Verrucomicrobiales bacterium]
MPIPLAQIKDKFTGVNTGLRRFMALLLVFLLLPQRLMAAGPAPVDLLSTAPFVILSGAGITSTGGGIITGSVGSSPIAGSAIGVTCAQVVGIIYSVDASGPPCKVTSATLLTTAKGDLTTAYNDAAGRTPVPSGPFLNPNGGNMGGLILAPGLYKFTGTALITGADLTLNGGPNDVWIFQIASDLQLGSGIKVILSGGALAKNIFWQVGTSAVLGTFSVMKGTILADQSITINTSATLEGRALAFTGSVVFNGNAASLPAAAPTAPEIAVEQPLGIDIPDGGSRNFGTVLTGNNNSLTFTIKNTGSADLTGLGITIDGADASSFTVTANPVAPVSGPAGSTTFTVRFAPLTTGLKTAALHIANNDSDEGPFDIALTGTGTLVAAPEIVVEQPLGVDIADGGSRVFGSVALGLNNSLTFTIKNIGTADLTGLGITLDGVDSSQFSVTANPTAP